MSEYIYEHKPSGADHMGKPVELPTLVQREEIVRCRDCIYYAQDPDPIDPGWPMMCERTGDDMVEPYGFCAWGAREEVDA